MLQGVSFDRSDTEFRGGAANAALISFILAPSTIRDLDRLSQLNKFLSKLD